MKLSYIHEAQQPQRNDLGHLNDMIECELCGENHDQEEFHKPVPCSGCGQLMENDTEGCSICAKGLCPSCWGEWVLRNFSPRSKELPENHFDDTEDIYLDMDMVQKQARRAGISKLSHKYKP